MDAMQSVEIPHVSIKLEFRTLGIDKTSVWKTLHEHKYKIHLVHELNKDAYDSRVEFVKKLYVTLIKGPFILKLISYLVIKQHLCLMGKLRDNLCLWDDINL